MRKLLFFIILIGIAICIAPYVDGYLFKKIYYQQVAILNQEIQSRDKDMQLNVQSYELGWLTSTVNLAISVNDAATPNKPVVSNVKSIIHHGPLVHADNKWQVGYAFVETYIYLPDKLNELIPAQANGFMQINSLVSLTGDKWTSRYTIPAVASRFVNWGGLNGDIVLDTVNGEPVKVTGNTTIEKIYVPVFTPMLPEVTVEPIKSGFDATQQAQVWTGTAYGNMGGLIAKWQDGSSFSVKNINRTSTYGINNGLYSFKTKLTIESVQFPASLQAPNLSNIMFSLNVNNINLKELTQNYKQYSEAAVTGNTSDELVKMLTATTTADTQLTLNSDLGPASATVNISLQALPKTDDELKNNVNLSLNARVARPILEKTMESMIRDSMTNPTSVVRAVTPVLKQTADTMIQDSMTNPSSPAAKNVFAAELMADLPNKVKMIFAAIIQQGYLQQDKNDYLVVYSRKGADSVLNGKTVTDNDLMGIGANVSKIVATVLAPPPPPPVAKVVPVVKVIEYHCYWLDTLSGKEVWKLVENTSKASCFSLDSCTGGESKSGGVCYKWAETPEAKAQPWDAPAPQP